MKDFVLNRRRNITAIKFGFNWTFHSIYLPKPTLLTFDNMNASEIVITEPYKHISLSEFQRH